MAPATDPQALANLNDWLYAQAETVISHIMASLPGSLDPPGLHGDLPLPTDPELRQITSARRKLFKAQQRLQEIQQLMEETKTPIDGDHSQESYREALLTAKGFWEDVRDSQEFILGELEPVTPKSFWEDVRDS